MTTPTKLLALIAVTVLFGCGDPAPSTPLAPEQKMPDISKLPPDQVNKMLDKNNSSIRK